ncbi:concanavalin A-like lectin/glucanase [Tanacetum coccineum]|uniref:Concanavalin A-like lectin/glucanase n=1 Tax=Tanacetum coccineum TaxID=301880 RepID=A0ABQ5J8C5_9ASTR
MPRFVCRSSLTLVMSLNYVWILCRVLVIAQNLTCNPYDLRGLTGLVNGLDSLVDGWWFTNASSNCCDWVGITCDASSGRIVRLDLPNKRLSGLLPVSLFNLALLEEVDLSGNFFDEVLPVSVNLPALQVFGFNYFTGVMPLQYKDCYFLEHLSVASNYISGVIPDFLFTLPRLRELALEDNEFTNITKLLDLSYNQLTGSIPSYFGDFKFLFYLDLSNNSLSGEIPKSLTRLQSLISRDIALEDPSPDFPFFKNKNISSSRLTLQYNQIMRFPPQLDLSRNYLTGRIWPEFGNLKKLHALDLRNYILSGTIPCSLSGMTSIEALDMSYNSLTGIIPSSFVRLSFLSKFSVAYNNLTGIITSGGQFWTFPNSSFEGNRGLCGNFFVNCPKNQGLLPPPAAPDKDEDFSILRMIVIIGFGTGFLLTVIPLLVVPGIKGAYKKDKFE